MGTRKRRPLKAKRKASVRPTIVLPAEPMLSSTDPMEELFEDGEDEAEEGEYLDYNYSPPGSAPGTLNIPDDALPTELVLIDYDRRQAIHRDLKNADECISYLDKTSVSWIDARGLGSEPTLRRLGSILKLHPLVLEDVVNVPHRPKIDYYSDHLLIIMRMVRPKKSGEGISSEQVSFVLGRNFLVTFQEEPHWDCFDPVRDRIRRSTGTIRHQSAAFLAYTLLDAIIDSFFPVLEELGEVIECLEEEVVENPTRETISKIHDLRRDLMMLRRSVWPQRSIINSLIRDGDELIGSEIRIYLQDCYDHIVQVLDIIETYREIVSSLMDVYLSSISNRMNEVMKVLTVISTIFIPLTFIAGVYGMNFDPDVSPFNMPELEWYWGYPMAWAVMIAIAAALIYYFWRRGWFENFSPTKR
ncbi:MAG: magnesium/cobalt transporter CorA [Cyanobacteria bacterium Co-bin13]|nr:magnesium/cobalt transporter CorA [Cyanobacteria bacterium Co-bin13]